ncbi:hypothetical protein [Microbacterium sp. YJN-G]|uniref:hypothetical protein n=1 Tax=Microbacterium sp. YJN-G TaxID=2763257 RepID=UPI001878631C|nr:hypothetical protein [Microbacterium sp. YJN-G]
MRGTYVRVGGVTFHGSDPAAAPVEGFVFVEFEGWNDAPSARGEKVPRPDAHGDFDLPVTRGPRLVTMSGWCRASSPERMGHFRSQLTGLLADGQLGRIIVDEFGVTQWADVRIYGDPRFRKRGRSRYADWSIAFRSPDARKYGETREFAAGETAVHYGNFPATPTHRVTGTAGGYTINGPSGKKFTVTSGPGSGTDRIDMATGRVYRNGVLMLGIVSQGDLWTVGPGLPGVVHTISAGTLTTEATDTFV